MMWHKCVAEDPVHEQRGAVQCPTCKKWFRSRGEFKVHSCNPDQYKILTLLLCSPIVGVTVLNLVVKQKEGRKEGRCVYVLLSGAKGVYVCVCVCVLVIGAEGVWMPKRASIPLEVLNCRSQLCYSHCHSVLYLRQG